MKANILQKSIIAAGILGGLVSLSSQAADRALTFSFETIVDVSIVEVQGLDFGSDLSITVASTCELKVNATDRPGSIAARQGLAVVADEAGTFQSRDGDCDTTAKGTAGIYRIAGAPGLSVQLTVNPIAPAADTDFSFVPQGAVVGYADGGADGDTLTNVDSGTQLPVVLASAADTGTTGSPIAGQSLLFVGGTLTAQRQLTAGETYNTQTFTIDVVYGS